MKKIISRLIFLLLIAISLGETAFADLADGKFLGVVALVQNGPPETKTNVIFLGDGFTESEQELFNDRINAIAAHLFSRHPFYAMQCAFNVFRINVASAESGIDIPATCNGSNIPGSHLRKTAMNATYCNGNTDRCILGNAMLVSHWIDMAGVANFNDPNVFVYVIVNETKHGGCASGHLAFGSIENGFDRVFVHEFGHALSNLADEYTEDPPLPFNGPERENSTTHNVRDGLKWGDLVLSSTAIPTKNCKQDQGDPFDLVGLFEGASRADCGVFRPSSKCTMRDHEDEFCSVCRRKIIRDLSPFMCTPISLAFTDLLIRDAQEPFWRGDGEIYFNYTVSDDVGSSSGRWPGNEGESDFGDGDEKSLGNFFAGTLSNTGNVHVNLKVRESDWPDGDDDLSSDVDQVISVPGAFTIDKNDYRLKGNAFDARIKLLLDMVNIKDDHDDFSDGDIYIKYTISNGTNSITGRWPSGDGNVGIGSGETSNIGIFAAALPEPAAGNNLKIHVEVWDDDDWFTGGDDLVGSDDIEFSASDHFGTDQVVHVMDKGGYRLTFSLTE